MENLITNISRIYNTLCLIETKGEATKNMAACLNALEEVIAEANKMMVTPEVSELKEKKAK